jgi:predicted nuclease of predicted toxin-antitoxin system
VRIVADENIDKQTVDLLRANGHEVEFVAEFGPGIDDDTVLLLSRRSNAVLLTADKDFGELVFRQRLIHSGVLLIRLAGLAPQAKAELVALTLDQHGEELRTGFAVLSERALRLRKSPSS